MSSIINDISKNLNIQINKELMTPIDSIKIIKNILENNKLQTIIKNNISYLNSNEKFLLDSLLDDRFYISILLSQNHTTNLLSDIYFIISNPNLFTLPIFNIIYNERELIHEIPFIIKKIFIIIIKSRLKKFYNHNMINRFIKCLDFEMITKDKLYNELSNELSNELYNKYYKIWSIFKINVQKTKDVLSEILIKYIGFNNNPGCSNLLLSDYTYIVKTHIGLELTRADIRLIINFSHRELKHLITQFTSIISKLRPEYSNLPFREIIKKLKGDSAVKCKTTEEYIRIHREYMEKSNNKFIREYKFPQFNQPKLLTFNSKNKGHAYWSFDTFYLNMANWEKINKYEILALVLHETIPGHHLHLNYSIHDKNNSDENILCNLFNMGINGFSEGLGLYAENLYENFSDWEKLGQIQYDIFRTIRIIIDTAIHISGESIETMIKFMKQYMSSPDESIEVEIYRYSAMPGQALSYKLGCEIIKAIVKKFANDNLMSDKSIEIFKKILINKEKPLKFLLEEYKLILSDVFQ